MYKRQVCGICVVERQFAAGMGQTHSLAWHRCAGAKVLAPDLGKFPSIAKAVLDVYKRQEYIKLFQIRAHFPHYLTAAAGVGNKDPLRSGCLDVYKRQALHS